MHQGTSRPPFFEELEHTADWKIRVWGKDYAELFRNAALAMYAIMGEYELTDTHVTRVIAVDGVDYPSLLVAWLSELLFYTEVYDEVFDDVDISSITPTHLDAQAYGHVAHIKTNKIKAVTYHDLEIREVDDHVEAIIVFDV